MRWGLNLELDGVGAVDPAVEIAALGWTAGYDRAVASFTSRTEPIEHRQRIGVVESGQRLRTDDAVSHEREGCLSVTDGLGTVYPAPVDEHQGDRAVADSAGVASVPKEIFEDTAPCGVVHSAETFDGRLRIALLAAPILESSERDTAERVSSGVVRVVDDTFLSGPFEERLHRFGFQPDNAALPS